MNLKVGMDSKTIQFLSKNRNNENVKKLLKELNMSMSIDVSSIAQFRKSDVDNVRAICEETGCKIDKVYVNTGWDEAAKQGYSFDKYDKIVGNAEKMLNRDKTPITSHTTSKVPFIICNDEIKQFVYI